MKKPLLCSPNMNSVILCLYNMMSSDAKEYGVDFESIRKTFILDEDGIASWDLPIK